MKRSLSFLYITLCMLVVLPNSHALAFLDMNPTIQGESSTLGHTNVIELQSFAFLSANSFVMTKYADTASFLLFQADLNGTVIPSMDLLYYGGDPLISVPFLTFHFTNSAVISFTPITFGNSLSGESVYFSYAPPPAPIVGVPPDFTPWVDPQPEAGFSYTSGVPIMSAVPEPATYTMLLAGLGLIGFMTLRKQQTYTA